MANTVTINKKTNVCEIYFDGEQTAPMVDEVVVDVLGIANELASRTRNIVGFADVTTLTKVNMGAMKAGVRGISAVNFDKLAILGRPDTDKASVNWVIRMSGKGDRVQYFTKKTQAIDWLTKAGDPVS